MCTQFLFYSFTFNIFSELLEKFHEHFNFYAIKGGGSLLFIVLAFSSVLLK